MSSPVQVHSISLLRSLQPTATTLSAAVRGKVTPGDGGGGLYTWDATSTAQDNGDSVVAVAGIATGRWVLVSPRADANAAKKPQVSDRVFFVSTNGNDSNDGLSMGTAFLTLAAAKAALGTDRGTIRVLGGTYLAPSTGMLLGQFQSLEGIGDSTIISGADIPNGTNLAPAPAVIGALGGYQHVRSLLVSNVPQWGVGVRVSIGGGGSTEHVRLTDLDVYAMGSNSTAYAIGDDTNLDVSGINLFNCRSEGKNDGTTVAIVTGNGGTGNVLDINVFGGAHYGHKYAVILNGGGLVGFGISFQSSSVADIYNRVACLGHCSLRGSRSENAFRFLISTAAYPGVVIEDYEALNLHNTDGQGIQVFGNGVKIKNVVLEGATCPQFVYTEAHGQTTVDSDFVTQFTVEGISTEHPYPLGGSPWSRAARQIRARDTEFMGDINGTLYAMQQQKRWVRRLNVSVANQTTLVWPKLYDVLEIRLAANAGAVTLPPGTVPGQSLTLVFDQDGVGGWTYSWPANIAWDSGSAPASVTTARNRQSCELVWTGTYWEQRSAVRNTLPPTLATQPISDTFTNPSNKRGRYWIGTPDGTGPEWEQLPGGGAFGIQGNKLVTCCLGWVGDNDLDNTGGGAGSFGQGAAAVIETGMPTQATGIQATFVWQVATGIICRYIDDQTFVAVYVTGSLMWCQAYRRGTNFNYGFVGIPAMVAGSTHTLLVKCTPTGVVATLDPGGSQTQHTFTFSANDQAIYASASKHGVVATSLTESFSAFSVS